MNALDRIQDSIASRREFLKSMTVAGLMASLPRLARGQAPESPDKANFVFTRVIYDRGDWNTDMLTEGMLNGSEVNLLDRLNTTADIMAFQGEHAVRADADEIFDHPFLYITGHGDCDLTPLGRENVKRILENGGFMLADNCSGAKNVGFDRSIRGQLQLMFPELSMEPVPISHPIFRSFYNIDRVQGGDKLLDPFLEGMDINGRTAVIYTRNDLGCAWEGHPCSPGGESQRRHAFEMGVNMIYYALSGI